MTSPPKILLIDDDADFRASTRALLEADGYAVSEATSGREGLDAILVDRPDLIVLDVMMETFEEGYGVTQAIKFRDEYRDCREVPVLMVSSIRESPDERFPLAGELEMIRPDRYMTKPLDVTRFLDLVGRLAKDHAASV